MCSEVARWKGKDGLDGNERWDTCELSLVEWNGIGIIKDVSNPM